MRISKRVNAPEVVNSSVAISGIEVLYTSLDVLDSSLRLWEFDRSGTVEPGKMADLVLLDGDPLGSISNVRRVAGVMRQGRWVPRSEIDRELGRIRETYRTLGTQKGAW